MHAEPRTIPVECELSSPGCELLDHEYDYGGRSANCEQTGQCLGRLIMEKRLDELRAALGHSDHEAANIPAHSEDPEIGGDLNG